MKANSKWFITKSIGIVPELFASRMLFVCFILIFTMSYDIDTTSILCIFQRYETIQMKNWARAHKDQEYKVKP